MERFVVLQKRGVSVSLAALCPSMDLCVIYTEEGTVAVYRTLSWEKVCLISVSDILPNTADAKLTSMAFSTNGKVIGIGSVGGSLAVLDIENGEVFATHSANLLSCNESTSILSVTWRNATTQARKGTINSEIWTNKIWSHGGLNLVDRIGMEDVCEPGDLIVKTPIDTILNSAKDNNMFSLRADGLLQVHINGIYPIFSLLVSPFDSDIIPYAGVASTAFDSVHITSKLSSVTTVDYSTLSDSVLFELSSNVAEVWLRLESAVSFLVSLLAPLGRKWKDALRPISAKLSLLQALLDGYQMSMNAVEFLYSVALCGPWHPAAVTHFAQHWNEQGVTRLRGALDGVSKTILWTLQMRAIPTATNILLHCRELQSIYESANNKASSSAFFSQKVDMSQILDLIANAERLLFVLDDTLTEARRATDALFDILQFIRENSIQPETAQAQNFKPDLRMRGKYLRVLDPRVPRAFAGSAYMSAPGEVLVGTHLYAYLLETELPLPIGAIAPAAGIKAKDGVFDLADLVEEVVIMIAEDEVSDSTNSQFPSVVTQIQVLKASLRAAFIQPHELLTVALTGSVLLQLPLPSLLPTSSAHAGLSDAVVVSSVTLELASDNSVVVIRDTLVSAVCCFNKISIRCFGHCDDSKKSLLLCVLSLSEDTTVHALRLYWSVADCETEKLAIVFVASGLDSKDDGNGGISLCLAYIDILALKFHEEDAKSALAPPRPLIARVNTQAGVVQIKARRLFVDLGGKGWSVMGAGGVNLSVTGARGVALVSVREGRRVELIDLEGGDDDEEEEEKGAEDLNDLSNMVED